MALDKAGLKAAIQASYEDLADGKSAADAAQEVADAIDDYVKTAIATVQVPAGTFLVGATGPGVVPVPNPAPVALVGDPGGAPPGGLT